jgi:hypothetical protein
VKRRELLGVASVGVLAALWPPFLREAFGDDPPACDGTPLARLVVVASAFRRARAAGRSLLVLVVPADDAAKWDRGQTFGELLNHGADRDLAPLANAEVVCATMEDLRKLVPTAGVGEPLMVLVHPERVPVTTRQLDVTLPPYGPLTGDTWQAREQAEDSISDQRIAALGGLLRRELGIDEKQAPALAADVRARLRDKPPAGTKWAKTHGCGTEVEGEPPMSIGCGMGHVPKKASRFLYFFSKRTF